MWPLLAAGVSGISSLIGGAVNNAANAESVRETNAQNAMQADLNRQYQTQMSNTAYQRATADMKAAGINPMLAYMKGGASTPSGGQATMQATRYEDALGKGVSSAVDALRLRNEMRSNDADLAFKAAATKTQEAQAEREANSAKVAGLNAKVLNAQMPAIQSRASADKKTADWDDKAADADAIMKRIGQGVGIATDATSIVKLIKSIGKKTDNRSSTEKAWYKGLPLSPEE